MNRRVLLAGMATGLLSGVARAQLASAPIRLVVPFAAGGSPDLIARYLASSLGDRLGGPVIVENRAGASGGVGTTHVVNAAPNGLTWLMASTGPLTVNPAVQADIAYDPVANLEPVILIGRSPLVLLVNNDLPVRSLAELLALAKREPGKLSYGSAGVGNLTNLVGEMLKMRAGIDLLHVPYQGTGALRPDLIAGRISMTFDTAPAALPVIRAGQARPIAVTTKTRAGILPELPTISELGIDPDFDVSGWFALLAPKGTPPESIERMHAAVSAILKGPDAIKQFAQWGIDIDGGNPDRLRRLISDEIVRWKEVVRVAGIRTQ